MIITHTTKRHRACPRNLGARTRKTDPGLKSPEYVYVYMHPTWWLCVCIHTYIPFRYNHTHIMHILPQVGWIRTHFFPWNTLHTHLRHRANTYTYHYIIIMWSYIEDGVFVHDCVFPIWRGWYMYVCVLPVLHIRCTLFHIG